MEDISRRETILKEQNVEGYSLSDVFSPWGRSGISAWLRGKYVWLSNMKNKAGSRFSDAWKMKIEKAFIDDIKKKAEGFKGAVTPKERESTWKAYQKALYWLNEKVVRKPASAVQSASEKLNIQPSGYNKARGEIDLKQAINYLKNPDKNKLSKDVEITVERVGKDSAIPKNAGKYEFKAIIDGEEVNFTVQYNKNNDKVEPDMNSLCILGKPKNLIGIIEGRIKGETDANKKPL